jgi:hypothetical protein
MNLIFLYDDVIVSCIIPYLDCKDKYNLSVTNKLFTNLDKRHKKLYKRTNDDIYIYITKRIKENIENDLHMFLDLLFNDFIPLNDRIYKYGEDLDDGVYYYSKNIYYKEYHSPLYFYPIINFRSHNLYMIVFVKNGAHKTRVFKNYYSSLYVIEDPEINYINLKFNEKVLKLV